MGLLPHNRCGKAKAGDVRIAMMARHILGRQAIGEYRFD